MKLVEDTITINDLKEMASNMFGDLVKAVVDVEKEIMVVDAELHSDEEAFLLQAKSKQQDLWGINIYPKLAKGQRIEFDSMINLRPSQGNASRSVDDTNLQKEILRIVNSKIVEK